MTQYLTDDGLFPTYSPVTTPQAFAIDENTIVHFINNSAVDDIITIIAQHGGADLGARVRRPSIGPGVDGTYGCPLALWAQGGELILGDFDLTQYNPLELHHSHTTDVTMAVFNAPDVFPPDIRFLATQNMSQEGIIPSYLGATAGPDMFFNTGNEILMLKNIDYGSHEIIVSDYPIMILDVPHDRGVPVGPFPLRYFGKYPEITYDNTNLYIALLRDVTYKHQT